MENFPKYEVVAARELRRTQTPSEERLWSELRGHKLAGLGFRRQHPVGRFVTDFCCEKAKLIVEVDGGYHEAEEQCAKEQEREAHLLDFGYQIMRVTSEYVMTNLNNVLVRIKHTAQNKSDNSEASNERLPSPPRSGGRGRGWGHLREGGTP